MLGLEELPTVINVCSPRKDYLSVRALLSWVNKDFEMQLVKLGEFRSGAVFCQILHRLYPKWVPLHKVNFSNNALCNMVNFEILKKCFNQLSITKEIPVHDLYAGRGILEFAKWYYKFYLANKNEDNAKTRREPIQLKCSVSSLSFNRNQGTNLRTMRSQTSADPPTKPINPRAPSRKFIENRLPEFDRSRRANSFDLLIPKTDLSQDVSSSQSIIRNRTYTVIALRPEWRAFWVVGKEPANEYLAKLNTIESGSTLTEQHGMPTVYKSTLDEMHNIINLGDQLNGDQVKAFFKDFTPTNVVARGPHTDEKDSSNYNCLVLEMQHLFDNLEPKLRRTTHIMSELKNKYHN